MVSYAERRRAVLANAGCSHLTAFYDRIDVKHASFHKALEDELRRMIAPVVAVIELGQNIPNLLGRLAFSDAESRDLESRFHDPRRRDTSEKVVDLILIEYARKFRTGDAVLGRQVPHREFVAKASQERAVHSGELKVFARKGGSYYVEFIKPDDAVDLFGSRDIRDRPNIIHRLSIIFDRANLADRIPRPRRIEQLLARNERNAPAVRICLLKKLIAFVFAGNADDVVLHRSMHVCPETGS